MTRCMTPAVAVAAGQLLHLGHGDPVEVILHDVPLLLLALLLGVIVIGLIYIP